MYMYTNTSNNFTKFIAAPRCFFDPGTLTEQVFKGIAFFIIIFGSLLGNVLVICVVILNRQMRTVTNYLIVNMAVADLLITAFSMPVNFKQFVTGHMDWSNGALSEILCKVIPFIQPLSIAGSVFSLTAIAVDRFLAIMFPLKRFITFQISYGIMVVIWIVGIAVSSPILYAQKVVSAEGNFYCVEIWTPAFTEEASNDFTVVLFVFFYLIPLLTMSVLYSFVVHKLWVRKVPGNPSVENQLRAQNSKKKVLKMLMTVVIIFALCWLPVFIIHFISFFNKENFPCGPPAIVIFMGYFLSHANSAINPAIYFIFNADFRKGFKDFLRCNCRTAVPKRNVRNHAPEIGEDNKFIDGIRPLAYRPCVSRPVVGAVNQMSPRAFVITAL